MKIQKSSLPKVVARACLLLALVLGLFCPPQSRAGLTVDIHLYHDSYGYYFYPFLSTNTVAPAFPTGTLLISSPEHPTNGSWLVYSATPTSFDYGDGNGNYGGGSYYNTFDAFLNAITNGLWSIDVTNAVSTNHYKFKVTVTGLTSNVFGVAAQPTFPTQNELYVASQPVFTWNGPANWAGDLYVGDDWIDSNGDYFGQASDSLPPGEISWPCPVVLPDGTNEFYVRYLSNVTATVVAATPTNAAAQAISGWISTANLETWDHARFVVGQPQNAFDLFLVARYDFEITNSPGIDSSGHDNHANCGSGNGGTNIDTFTTNVAVGTYARKFGGDTSICFGPGDSSFNSLSNALMHNFSVSAWVKTTNSVSSDFDNAFYGAPVLFAYDSDTNSTVPLAITGSKAAFTVNDPLGNGVTIHSTTSVNDGNYHLLVVTRNQTSGLMSLYVDGVLEATDTGTTEPLFATSTIYLAGGWFANFEGIVDDVRIYSTALSANDVATLAGIPVTDFNSALNTTNLVWTTGGDAPWYVQTTNTHDNVSAVQSGAIDDDGQTWIETTVVGPGDLSFWWKASSEEEYDYLVLYVDGNFEDYLTGDSGWQQYFLSFGPGSHTLHWLYYKDSGSADGFDAAFLDEVSFIFTGSTQPPVITLHPFSQTNQPGYNVALLAAATGDGDLDWRWFKTGNASPIPNATNALFIPTNSGTAGVAGNYFAVVTNSTGSATTFVATVTFQSAAQPPDWSPAFRAQIYGSGNEQPTTNYGIACLVDGSGNIYAANSFSGTNYFGSELFASSSNRFSSGLFKHTTNGTALWGRAITNLDGTGNSYPQCLAPAPGDGVYMSGVFQGTNWLGTNRLVDVGGASVYLARFDANGSNLWVRTFGGTNSCFQSYHQLVADPSGNVTISALIQNTVSFGTTNLTVDGQKPVLVQYDASGNLRWIQQSSGWLSHLAYSAGRIYGSMGGNETNYVGGLTNTSDRHWSLVALQSTNGQAVWLRGIASALGSSTPGDTAHVTVSGTNVFVVGSGAGSNAVFGAYSVSWPADVGQYFARYDTNGNAQLAVGFGSPTTLPWTAVADASGNVYVGGDFDTWSRFGDKLLAAAQHDTLGPIFPGQTFVAKFDRNGNSLWARQAQSPTSYVNLRDIALAGDGVWSCGFVNQYAYFGSNYVGGTVTCIGFPFCTIELHAGGWLAKIKDTAVAAVPVSLFNPQYPGSAFQFQFNSQAGVTHAVQFRTNLATGNNWQTWSNVTGDGSLKTLAVPLSTFSPAQQGFIRVLTQ